MHWWLCAVPPPDKDLHDAPLVSGLFQWCSNFSALFFQTWITILHVHFLRHWDICIFLFTDHFKFPLWWSSHRKWRQNVGTRSIFILHVSCFQWKHDTILFPHTITEFGLPAERKCNWNVNHVTRVTRTSSCSSLICFLLECFNKISFNNVRITFSGLVSFPPTFHDGIHFSLWYSLLMKNNKAASHKYDDDGEQVSFYEKTFHCECVKKNLQIALCEPCRTTTMPPTLAEETGTQDTKRYKVGRAWHQDTAAASKFLWRWR